MNPLCMSLWTLPAASGALVPLSTVQARTSLPPVVVKKVIRFSRR